MHRSTLACMPRLEDVRDELSWGQGRRAVSFSDMHATERDATFLKVKSGGLFLGPRILRNPLLGVACSPGVLTSS